MATSIYDLYDDNQKTSAIGFHPLVGATQGGPMDKTITAIGVLATSFDRDAFTDARDRAFSNRPNGDLPKWKRGEATGVHAEAIIIRAWLDMLFDQREMTLENAIASLKGRTISASQPACWCCYALMKKWGIVFDNVLGNKPLTGWRHPLHARTIPNSDLPDNPEAVWKMVHGIPDAIG